MDRLTVDKDGQFVPIALCTIGRDGKVDICDGCIDYCTKQDIRDNRCTGCAIQDCFDRLGTYEVTGFTPEQIHNQKHNLGISYNIISGYEQCIREIFGQQQEHNGRQYIDAEEAAGIIDKIMSGRLKEVKR